MNTRLDVSNLAATKTCNDLRDLFSVHGNVTEVNLPVDRVNERPCGFGTVTMATPEGARAALAALNGNQIGTHALICALLRYGAEVRSDEIERFLVLDRKWSRADAAWVSGRIKTGLDILKVDPTLWDAWGS